MNSKTFRLACLSLAIFALALSAGIFLSQRNTTKAKSTSVSSTKKTQKGFVAHEWGTFTSIAGQDGVAIDWQPLNGPSDLPKFVYSLTSENAEQGLRRSAVRTQTNGQPQVRPGANTPQTRQEVNRPAAGGKRVPSTIRMETPVIYFYTDEQMDVSVKVDFPDGRVTEWYPRARSVNNRTEKVAEANNRIANGGIDWGKFTLMPYTSPFYLREPEESHYYPARETDAVPISVYGENDNFSESEKFLFYRGIGNFDLPLTAKLEGDNVILGNRGGEPISNLILFENRSGKIGFKTVEEVSTGTVAVKRPALNQPLEKLLANLESLLISQGLYEKEAKAMIKTWRDSWFEEGLRVFYVLPRKNTDEILPIKIEPTPQELVRVLVGRTELITSEMEKEVKTQVGLLRSSSKQVREEAAKNLQKHGRFYEPILKSILRKETDATVKMQIMKLLTTAN